MLFAEQDAIFADSPLDLDVTRCEIQTSFAKRIEIVSHYYDN
jgi:hypothetical protein